MKGFSLFFCTNCFTLECNDDTSEQCECVECGSDRYIKRYVKEKGVNTPQQAIDFYRRELVKERDKLTNFIVGLNQRYGPKENLT